MKEQNSEQAPLASPFELAQLATSLAILRGGAEPDIEGALSLLRIADGELRFPTQKYVNVLLSEEEANEWVKVWAKSLTAFPGADKISLPERDVFLPKKAVSAPNEVDPPPSKVDSRPKGDDSRPKGWSFRRIVATVINRTESGRIEKVIRTMIELGKLEERELTEVYPDHPSAWRMARRIAPFAPRFKSLYPGAANPIKRKRAKKSGRYIGTKHDDSGKFKQSSPES